jgi:spore maturation protein CgeB
MWRVDYSRFWANHFKYVTTSDVNGLNKFRDVGFSNVLYSPFACNTEFFIKKNLPKCYDVSFIGGWSPYRAWYLQKIRNAGIDIRGWGIGWKEGSVSYGNMIDIFNQSRINLNLSNSASWDVRYLMTLKRPIKNTVRAWRNCLSSLYRKDMKTREQIKGRHFEINSCGGFQLSYYVEGLERHYQIGEEIALYESIDEIIDKIRYYLKHDEEREAIAKRGYLRTRSAHTMEKRLKDLFEAIDKPSRKAE